MNIRVDSVTGKSVVVDYIQPTNTVVFSLVRDEFPYSMAVGLSPEQADDLYRQLGAMLEEIQRAKEAA